MRITYHCNRTGKQYSLQVSSAPGFGLRGDREDEAAATNSLPAYTLVCGKGEHSLAAAFKERDVITCRYRWRSSYLSKRNHFETMVLQTSCKKYVQILRCFNPMTQNENIAPSSWFPVTEDVDLFRVMKEPTKTWDICCCKVVCKHGGFRRACFSSLLSE